MPSTLLGHHPDQGTTGQEKVTEDRKNALIERAVSTWENMGLTNPQIAFATALMGHKSGFDANVQDAAEARTGTASVSSRTIHGKTR